MNNFIKNLNDNHKKFRCLWKWYATRRRRGRRHDDDSNVSHRMHGWKKEKRMEKSCKISTYIGKGNIIFNMQMKSITIFQWDVKFVQHSWTAFTLFYTPSATRADQLKKIFQWFFNFSRLEYFSFLAFTSSSNWAVNRSEIKSSSAEINSCRLKLSMLKRADVAKRITNWIMPNLLEWRNMESKASGTFNISTAKERRRKWTTRNLRF